MTGELTVAELMAREGLRWPADKTADEPRHLIAEFGELEPFWAEALTPRMYAPAAEDSQYWCYCSSCSCNVAVTAAQVRCAACASNCP